MQLQKVFNSYLCSRRNLLDVVQEEAAKETTKYTGEFPLSTWNEWKDTVPRSKKLGERLAELVELDAQARNHGTEIETLVMEHIETE